MMIAVDVREIYRAIVAASDTLRPEDKLQLLALLETDDALIAQTIRKYYGDLDRANRTPRMLMYFHIGWLVGIAGAQ